jgi:hypothetical protein
MRYTEYATLTALEHILVLGYRKRLVIVHVLKCTFISLEKPAFGRSDLLPQLS